MIDMGSSFLLSVLLGVFFGLCYDPLRILRILRREKKGVFFKVLTTIEDFLLLSTYGAFFSIFVFAVNDGVLRGFMLLGTLLGFLIYYFTVGRLVMAVSERIISFVRRAVRFVARILYKPLKITLVFVYNKSIRLLLRLVLKVYIYFISLPLARRRLRSTAAECRELVKCEALT